MLCSLTVRDFALFSSATFSPEEGFVALTGQTGAGKSLVVDALSFVTGSHRGGKDFIRNGKEFCEVRALFAPVREDQLQELAKLGIECEGDGIEFYRSLSRDARAVCRINGRMTTLTILRRAAGLFCDIHEQEDARALLSTSRHLFYLDAFLDEEGLSAKRHYAELYEAYSLKKEQFNAHRLPDRAEEKTLREFLEYQIRELTEAGIVEGEYDALLQEKERLAHAKQLSDATSLVQAALVEEDGAYDRLMRASDALATSCDVRADWKEIAERLENLAYEVQELARSASVEECADPTARLDAIDARLSVLRRLFHLYAPTEAELLSLLSAKKDELKALDTAKEQARRLHAEALVARDAALAAAQPLRLARHRAAEKLEAEILTQLQALDMPFVRFEVHFEEREKISQDGCDLVSFYIGTNVGQPMMELSSIASGGELSRILLALRCVLSQIDAIDTLVFDEIDTGVSGRSAVKIGAAMRRLGRQRQVLAVTHSAQVAAAACAQIKVEKSAVEGETVAAIYPLNEEERLAELARILGGETISETSLANARELLEQSK